MPVELRSYFDQQEQIGTGDGATITFTAVLSKTPIKPGSVTVTDGVETFTDNGDGTLTGSAGGSGTVNYTTGDISVTFATAPASGAAITASYKYYISWTFYAKRITIEERWRQKNIPLVNKDPYVIDLGMEEKSVEVLATVYSQQELNTFYTLRNPVEVVSSDYPEIEIGWWRLYERRSDRRPGWVNTWEVRFRMRRDYYYTG